jgi:hypothetical protein
MYNLNMDQDLPSDASDIHPTFKTALALFNALRGLGFKSDDIWFVSTPKDFIVEIHQGDKEYGIRAGSIDMSQEQCEERWRQISTAVSAGKYSQQSMDKLWEESHVMGNLTKLVFDLVNGGVRIPILSTQSN